jgi:hypothetical protein
MSDVSRIGFEYALLRVVPRVERGECMNVGVIVYSQAADFLGIAVHVDEVRLQALDERLDASELERALAAIGSVCAGGAGAGAAAALSAGQRFRWLVSPRSSVVQVGPVHTGMSDDVFGEPERLLTTLVRPAAD